MPRPSLGENHRSRDSAPSYSHSIVPGGLLVTS
jgi:hypothetical protein